MNRSYLQKNTGAIPYKHDDQWCINVPGIGIICGDRKKPERDSYAQMYKIFWDARRDQVLERDRYQCRLCRNPNSLSVDHIKSRGAGGTDEMENVRCLCATCHQNRHNYQSRFNDNEEDG